MTCYLHLRHAQDEQGLESYQTQLNEKTLEITIGAFAVEVDKNGCKIAFQKVDGKLVVGREEIDFPAALQEHTLFTTRDNSHEFVFVHVSDIIEHMSTVFESDKSIT